MPHSIKNSELLSNSWGSLLKLLAYDLFTFKMVFQEDGDEIVYVNDGAIGRLKVYVNGELVYRGWDVTGGCYSKVSFRHKDKTYTIKCVVDNLITWSQKVTLLIDKEIRQSDTDLRYGGFSWSEYARMTLGFAIIGVAVGLTLKLFGV